FSGARVRLAGACFAKVCFELVFLTAVARFAVAFRVPDVLGVVVFRAVATRSSMVRPCDNSSL
ncbi:MAG: hypothetical protein V4793_11525, partial [Paraburkholderia tropica]